MVLCRVCVFCGSSLGNQTIYTQTAQNLGYLLAQQGIVLVYGGANRGLMGAVADACLAEGGQVIGVMPRFLAEKEVANRGLTKLHIVESMHKRKELMADLSDAFIALPGGFGTWEEFLEVLTWTQIGLQQKPCALLNVHGFYDPLLAMANRAVADGFVHENHKRFLLTDTDPERLLARLATSTLD